MEHVYVDGHQTDFTVQTIEANPPMRGDDSVALYMGGERSWNIADQQFMDAPEVWPTFPIIVDEPNRGTIAVMTHDDTGYAEALDYIEINASEFADDETSAIMVEADQLYTGLHGRTLDYITRVMLDGNTD